jgi:hypothetical protein
MSQPILEKNPTFWFYGSASIAYGIKNNAFSYLLLIYANQVLGLPGVSCILGIGDRDDLGCRIGSFAGTLVG